MKNSQCTEDNKIGVGLKSPDALILSDKNKSFYGGDQAWFGDTADKMKQRKTKKGCAVTAAANILAYLAASDEKYGALYSGGRNRADFTAHLEAVSEHLKIGAFGVWGVRRFTRGVKSFAASRGVSLECKTISLYSAEKAAEFIKKALLADKPAAMLTGFNSTMKNISCRSTDGGESSGNFQAHWVTVTELLRENEKRFVKVSSWGKYAYISLDDHAEKEIFKKALICFY